ncbi:MAG: cytochrome c maturation protein CcmE [Actinomycetota bacterium]|jgi:cytochrome c-type biogenesis protein CcmE|nr:cytochrome c maturation protein CcmE [Actinomycetota bacterium]
MRRYRWFVVAALGLVAVLTGFLVANIGQDLVYYQTPSDVLADAGRVGAGRFRLGGQVVPGSIVDDGASVTFDVTDGQATVNVAHQGAPQQLFREGIGVVVEGTWDGVIFHSDSMIIKHDEQYRTEDGGVYTPDSRYPSP